MVRSDGWEAGWDWIGRRGGQGLRGGRVGVAGWAIEEELCLCRGVVVVGMGVDWRVAMVAAGSHLDEFFGREDGESGAQRRDSEASTGSNSAATTSMAYLPQTLVLCELRHEAFEAFVPSGPPESGLVSKWRAKDRVNNSSITPHLRRRHAVCEAADQVLAIASGDRMLWSRAILSNCCFLKVQKKCCAVGPQYGQ
ncbi:hypothetical protein Taro_044273 [Colocasia esculenta]|uniref:Uncharacterized protein n=1 Tax=Colocasia esculenta TaxID=4460 RepID=A0A843WIP6_COLES|nr:hypothetical protein [Colocasia esculenta]